MRRAGEGKRVRRVSGGERRKLVEKHCSGQFPKQPFPPIAVAVSADQSVVVQ